MSRKITGFAPVYRLRSSDDRALLFFCKSLCESKKIYRRKIAPIAEAGNARVIFSSEVTGSQRELLQNRMPQAHCESSSRVFRSAFKALFIEYFDKAFV